MCTLKQESAIQPFPETTYLFAPSFCRFEIQILTQSLAFTSVWLNSIHTTESLSLLNTSVESALVLFCFLTMKTQVQKS